MFTALTQRDLLPAAQRAMVAHGCSITYHPTHSIVTFPEGTTRTENIPRMPGGERFTLVLPDGYIMQQQYIRYLDQYLLFCAREDMFAEEEGEPHATDQTWYNDGSV